MGRHYAGCVTNVGAGSALYIIADLDNQYTIIYLYVENPIKETKDVINYSQQFISIEK